MIRRHPTILCLCLAVALLAAPRAGRGAGFAIQEQNGRGVGSAFAGEAASAEDASTIWFNPAGLTLLSGTQFVGAGAIIRPSADFDNRGSTLNPAVGGGRLRGGNGPDPGEVGLAPSGYLAHALSDRWRIGLGVSAPFGLRTEYDRFWVGRYHATVSELKTVNVNPTVAVRLLDWLSVGAGLDVMYAHAKLTNAIDLGSVCQIQGGLSAALCARLGLRPQGADGFVKVTGDSWGVGYNLGVLFEPSRATRIGVAFRSKVDQTLDGGAKFFVPKKAAILKATGALVDTGAEASARLPEQVALAASHALSPRWTLLSTIAWTRWSRFQSLIVNFDNPAQPRAVQQEQWEDSFRYAFGVRYDPTSRWSFRAGTAYDENPIPDPSRRTPRIPDADRVWLAFGGGWQWTPRMRFDVGYAHIFSPAVSTRNRDENTGHLLRGHYDAFADVLAGQVTWSFR